MLWNLFWLLLLAQNVLPFRLLLIDNAPVINGTVGADLTLDIALQIRNLGTANSLAECSACMAINASVCHCFSENVAELSPYLPASCVSRPAPHRLSMYLICNGLTTASTSVYIPPSYSNSRELVSTGPQRKLSLVLPVELGDMPRFVILLRSLTTLKSSSVLELIVIVPDEQCQIFVAASRGFTQFLTFQLRVVAESRLLPRPSEEHSYYPYAIQMALKILVSEIVLTDFYITLDADVVLLRDFQFEDIVSEGRGLYHHEARLSAHPEWWQKSEAFLNISLDVDKSLQGFGATPAVLSTYGSMLVLQLIKQRLGGREDYIRMWVSSFGVSAVWSEYTLYRTTLDYLQIFDYLHFRENIEEKVLLCNPVWFASDLPWRPDGAYADPRCMFSLVQSTSGAAARTVLLEVERLMPPLLS